MDVSIKSGAGGPVRLLVLFLSSCIFFVFAPTVFPLFAQVAQTNQVVVSDQVVVSGQVVDVKGEPLAGVYVLIVGSQKGTSTDVDGFYELMAPADAVLEFSIIGFATQRIAVSSRAGADATAGKAAGAAGVNGTAGTAGVKGTAGATTAGATAAGVVVLDVVMQEESVQLDEVVVVGFGSQRKESLTGAVSTVNVERALENKPFTDPAKGLQGAVPGLTITFSNGAINKEPVLNIRGMGSLNASNGGSPLILVDNVVVNDISVVNADDIESVSVLKDASSTAIYGARAAFGIILIKTKSGKMGSKFSISYSNNFSWGAPTVLPQFPKDAVAEIDAMDKAMQRAKQSFDMFGMKAQPLMEGIERWKENYSKNRRGNQMIMGEDFEILDGVAYFYRLWDPVEEMYQDWTPQQNHNLQITGGTERISFALGGAYQYQEGILKIKPEKLNKYNFSLSVTGKVNDVLTVDTRVNMRQYDFKYPYSYQDPYYYMWRWGAYFPYGQYTDESGTNAYFRHIPGYLHNASYSSYNETYMSTQAGATLSLPYNIQLRSEFAYSSTHSNTHETGGYVALWDFWGGGLAYNTKLPSSSADETDFTSTKRTQITSNTFATYEQNFNEHYLKVTAGLNVEKGAYVEQYSKKLGLMDKDKGQLPLAYGTPSVDGDESNWAVAGWFARVNYSYKDRYLAEVSGRYDGSSNFPSHSRWAFFPSFSLGYRISEEEFFAPLKSIVSDMKLRGSYGLIGNQNVGSDRFIPKMSTASANWIVGDAKVLYTGLPANVSNNLYWEDIATLNLGADIRFLKNKYGITFDWYERVNRNMLSVGETLPEAFGTTAAMINDGRLRTRGWEITIDGSHTFYNGLNLYGNINISDYKSVITEWNSNSANLLTDNYKGKTIGEIWGFVTDRYFTSSEDVASSPSQVGLQSGNFVYGPGDIKFKDVNKDNVIDAGSSTLNDHGDLVKIGNTTPRYQYSIRIGGSYKGFDVDLYFQGIGKRNMWAIGNEAIPYYRGADVMYQHQMDFWTEENTNARYPRPYVGNGVSAISNMYKMADATANSGNNFYPQTKYLLNLSYLRMKNLTIGYTVPTDISARLHFEKIRVYFSGENLFEIAQRKIPIDAEITAGSSTSNFYGRTAPFSRTLSFGVQLGM